MEEQKSSSTVEVLTEEEFKKALHPGVYEKLKREGFAEYIGDERSYFVMDSDREFNEPARPMRASLRGATTLLYETTVPPRGTICYAHGVCNNQPTDNNTVLCKECVKLFIRNGDFVVDLIDKASCDDCEVEERAIRVIRSNRQLCMSCFKASLGRVRQKREEEMSSTRTLCARVFDVLQFALTDADHVSPRVCPLIALDSQAKCSQAPLHLEESTA